MTKVNKKYLLLIPVFVPFFVLFVIIPNETEDEHQYRVIPAEEMLAIIDKFESDTGYISERVIGASTRDIISAYSEADGDVEKAIKILQDKIPHLVLVTP